MSSYLSDTTLDILDKHKENIVFLTTADRDGCRVAQHYCKNCEVILLSERILPKEHANEGQADVRYFIYVILHEVVHAIKKHKSPKFDQLSPEEKKAQEDEADSLALEWFNQHIEALGNPHLKPLTKEDIELEQKKQQAVREQLYINRLRDCTKCEFDYKEIEVKNIEK
jgi:hypothetical protein